MFVLGSKSPRRKALLKEAGLEFEIVTGDFDEGIDEKNPIELVKKLSYYKAMEISEKCPNQWILSADTVVYLNDKILEKPESKDHARDMISVLSGNKHIVLTGYTVYSPEKHITGFVQTEVSFRELSNDDIEWYINTDEPYDKAGGYAIQGIGTFMVKGIKGSYSNVVGLPVASVIETMISLNVIRRDPKSCKYVSP